MDGLLKNDIQDLKRQYADTEGGLSRLVGRLQGVEQALKEKVEQVSDVCSSLSNVTASMAKVANGVMGASSQ